MSEQQRAYQRAYYAAHREQRAAHQRAYYAAHREQKRAMDKTKLAPVGGLVSPA